MKSLHPALKATPSCFTAGSTKPKASSLESSNYTRHKTDVKTNNMNEDYRRQHIRIPSAPPCHLGSCEQRCCDTCAPTQQICSESTQSGEQKERLKLVQDTRLKQRKNNRIVHLPFLTGRPVLCSSELVGIESQQLDTQRVSHQITSLLHQSLNQLVDGEQHIGTRSKQSATVVFVAIGVDVAVQQLVQQGAELLMSLLRSRGIRTALLLLAPTFSGISGGANLVLGRQLFGLGQAVIQQLRGKVNVIRSPKRANITKREPERVPGAIGRRNTGRRQRRAVARAVCACERGPDWWAVGDPPEWHVPRQGYKRRHDRLAQS